MAKSWRKNVRPAYSIGQVLGYALPSDGGVEVVGAVIRAVMPEQHCCRYWAELGDLGNMRVLVFEDELIAPEPLFAGK